MDSNDTAKSLLKDCLQVLKHKPYPDDKLIERIEKFLNRWEPDFSPETVSKWKRD